MPRMPWEDLRAAGAGRAVVAHLSTTRPASLEAELDGTRVRHVRATLVIASCATR